MSDITKCSNSKCYKKEACYRWTAPANIQQSYAEFKVNKIGWCAGYWKMKSRHFIKKLNIRRKNGGISGD